MAMDAFDVEGYCPPFRIYQFANPRIDASMDPKYPSIHQLIDPSIHEACQTHRGTFQRWAITPALNVPRRMPKRVSEFRNCPRRLSELDLARALTERGLSMAGDAEEQRDRLILKLEEEGEAEDAALDATLAKVGNNPEKPIYLFGPA